MCGIAGIVSYAEPVVDQMLKRMTDSLIHRGPDGEGYWVNATQRVGLGHRRLAVIDLTEAGKQPMHYLDRYTITFNGEIYNYLELKRELVQKGYVFTSSSDTEVLLALYDVKKEQCLHDLDGMFAFAIWDEKEKTLFCARDRFGEKPFYYYVEQNARFVFASEMKAIFSVGIAKETNRQMLFNYLNDHYVVSNPDNKAQTFYCGVQKLKQGHYLMLQANGSFVTKPYWNLNDEMVDDTISFEQAVEKFRSLFYQSVERRLRSDVPLGTSLSGGIDSSSIVCVIAELTKQRNTRQHSFSARFANFDKDEGPYIERVVASTGVQANYVWPEGTDFLRDFKELCYYQEEPFPSASIYAQYAVMRLAKQNKVTVLLDGQGADELLGGYEYYFNTFLNELQRTHRSLFAQQRDQLLQHQARFIDPRFSEATNTLGSNQVWTHMKNVLRPVYRVLNPAKYRHIPLKASETHRRESLFHKKMLAEFGEKDIFCPKRDHTTLNKHLKHSMFVDNLEDLLRFADRNAMAHSRELRLPFLSHELVEFTFSLPSHFKIQHGWSKFLLRKSMENLVPQDIVWRRDKVGYEPPQDQWMQGKAIQQQIADIKSDLAKAGILREDAVLTKGQQFAVLNAGYF